MTVQSPTASRFAETKPTGLYLMELRRHFAELHTRRQKVAIDPWVLSAIQQVPILRRTDRSGEGRS
jgi:hypothetical protein